MTDEQLTLKTLMVRARELRRAEQNGDAYFIEKTAETLNRVIADREELLKVLKNIRDMAPPGAWDDTFHQTPSWWRARVRNMHDAADGTLQEATMSNKKWTDEDVMKMAERAARLVENEIKEGAFGNVYKENRLIMECVEEALGAIESSIEWVIDEIEEGSWNPSMAVYASIKRR